MADVFISYKQEERAAIEQIATRLRALGLSVWFDASMSAGESFNDEIDREARAAKVVLVCWSPAARDSRWVKAEAMIGFEQNKLAACYVAGPDGFLPPAPFNTSHVEDLRYWLAAPSDTHAGWKSVLRRTGRLCGRADIESRGAVDGRADAEPERRARTLWAFPVGGGHTFHIIGIVPTFAVVVTIVFGLYLLGQTDSGSVKGPAVPRSHVGDSWCQAPNATDTMQRICALGGSWRQVWPTIQGECATPWQITIEDDYVAFSRPDGSTFRQRLSGEQSGWIRTVNGEQLWFLKREGRRSLIMRPNDLMSVTEDIALERCEQ